MRDDEKAPDGEGGRSEDGKRAMDSVAEDFEDRYKRALADLDNMRKRTEREIDALRKYASEALILDIIRSVEDLERAAENSKGAEEGLAKGVGMILADLKNTLKRYGVQRIDTSGDFDPSVHEAVLQECSDCADDDGKIAEVLQPGYKLHDRVIRHSKVKVYKFENKKESD